MHEKERSKEPRTQGVKGSQEGQAPQPTVNGGPSLDTPYEDARDDLERKENIQDPQVGDLLKRIQLPGRRLFKGMGFPLNIP